MLDALSYIDQLYQKSYHKDIVTDDWEADDLVMGY